MNTTVVLLTGNELRHEFFRKFIAADPSITVLATYCESEKGNLQEVIKQEEINTFRLKHLEAREVTEVDFFGLYCESVADKSNAIFIEKGHINDVQHVNYIRDLNPELIISYGCSIIKSELITLFERRFINVHLGLSPYYRGSGTNFWPFVNKELQFVGTTFMHIDFGVDTGEIIHQIRADIAYADNIHQIGNRLIKKSCIECIKIIRNFKDLDKMPTPTLHHYDVRYYKKKDFTEEALNTAYININDGLIENYLLQKHELDTRYPLVVNPALVS